MHWNTMFSNASNPYAALRRDFDRNPGLNSESSFGAMTVLESRDRWTVAVDVPGADLEDIDVTLTDGLLVVEGQRKSRSDDGAKEVFNDRTFAKFRRELRIRKGVDQKSYRSGFEGRCTDSQLVPIARIQRSENQHSKCQRIKNSVGKEC